MNNGKITDLDYLLSLFPGGITRPVPRDQSSSGKAFQDAAEARHGSRKTSRIVVDYNGAKVPWAFKTWVHTPEGKIRGANFVWDTYRRMDGKQGSP